MSPEECAPETSASRLLPILQEGIEVTKMVLYRKMAAFIAQRLPDTPATFPGQLAGAVLNDLFASPAELPEAAAGFICDHRALLDQERQAFLAEQPELRIVLTDSLRMQTICDLMAGLPDPNILPRAEGAGVLLSEREMPMPHTFIDMARRLGKANGLIVSPIGKLE